MADYDNKALRMAQLEHFKEKQDAFNEGKFMQKGAGENNVLEGVKVNGTALAIADKMVDVLVATGTADGTIKVNGSDISVAGLAALAFKSEVSADDLAAALKAKVDALDTLVGDDASKSVRAISAEEVAKVVDSAPEDYDTLREIAEYIASDKTGAAEINNAIGALKTKTELGKDGEGNEYATVKAYVEAVVDALGMDNYVTKETGKGLSTNDYTDTDKNKVAGIEDNAQVNVIETVKVNGTALTPSEKAVDVTVPTKTSQITNDSNFAVDASYVHTDNNYTTDEKNRLAGIAEGAQVNVVEVVKVNGSALTPSEKAVDIAVPTTVAALTDAADYLKVADIVWAEDTDVDALFTAAA